MISRRGLLIASGAAVAGGVLAAPAVARQQAARKAGENARFHPQDFGAAGDGASDDTEALLKLAEAANASARDGKAVEIHIASRHAVSRTITLRPAGAPFSVIGQGSDTGFVALGGGRFDCLAVSGGRPLGGATAVSPATRGSEQLVLASAAGLKAGDVLLVSSATGYLKDSRACLVEVAGVSGNRVSLRHPLPFDINPGLAATATRQHLVRGVKVANLVFNGRKATGPAGGLRCAYLHAPFIESIQTSHFAGAPIYGQVYGPCLGGRFHDLTDTGSGAGGSDSIKFINITDAQIGEITANQSSGIGIGITFVTGSRMGGLKSIGSAGRGLKLFGSCDNQLNNIVVNRSGKTGLSISSGSSHNRFTGIEARGNKESGVWLNGTDNSHNHFTHVTASGNGVDLMVAATAPLVDRGNVFTGQLSGFDKTVIAPATGTTLPR